MAAAVGSGGAILRGEKWRGLDPIAAMLVSVLIIKVAIELILPAINDLLERSLPDTIEKEIIDLTNEIEGVQDPHNLRTRRIGNAYAIEMHIRVEGNMTVWHAHNLTLDIEKTLRNRFGEETHIAIHVEPIQPF